MREPWISALLDGRKTWELRGSTTKTRGRIGLIESGTGHVAGEVTLTEVLGPLTLDDLKRTEHFHLVGMEEAGIIPYRSVYAWVMTEPQRYRVPVPYVHPRGAVIWVNL